MRVPTELAKRRSWSDDKVSDLREKLVDFEAKEIVGQTGCVYVTGSLARGEATEHRDVEIALDR